MDASAQVNLVPNYSFEGVDSCNFDFYDFQVLNNWFKPSNGTSDVFNSCTPSFGGDVPINSFGFQYAQHGEGYSGIMLYVSASDNYREYLGIRLTDTLKTNIYYCLKMYVSLSDIFPLASSSIGAFLSPDSIYQNNLLVLPHTPQIENPDSNFINDTTSWQLISGYYKALGGEKYLYIGNFRDDNNTVLVVNGNRSYVYVDNVQLYECDIVIGINENAAATIIIYPNPATTNLTINTGNLQNIRVELFDVAGRKLLQQKFVNSLQTLDVSSLSNGVYIAVVTTNNKVVKREKVIISR